MRWLFLSNDFPSPVDPGKAVFNWELVRSLGASDHVDVICPVPWPARLALSRFSQSPGLTAPPGVILHYPTYYYPPGVFRRAYSNCMSASVRGALARVLDSGRPDAVLSYWAHPDGDVAGRIARRLGVPAIAMVGGSDVLLLTRSRARRALILRALRRATLVATVNTDLRDHLVSLGLDADRIVVVPRGIDPNRFHPGDRTAARHRLELPESSPVFVWAGRMVGVKGVDVLLSALATARARGVAVRLHLLGDGPQRQGLEARARHLRLGDSCVFEGEQTHDRIADWLRAADCVVLPSHSEGTPNVLLEAKACGTAFIATNVGGIAALAIPGIDSLVPAGDSQALSDAIVRVVRSPRRHPHTTTQPYSLSDAAGRLRAIASQLRVAGAPLRSSDPRVQHA